jgi:hypothetical protein
MKIYKSPNQPHVYIVSGRYEYVISAGVRVFKLKKSYTDLELWLENRLPGKYQLLGLGRIKIDPDVELLFALKWQ